MKILASFLAIFFFFSVVALPVQAKVLPQAKGKAAPKKSGGAVGGSVGVSVKKRGDGRGLILYASNLSKANSVSYMLTYQTNGKDEGVSGSMDSSGGNSGSRELVFGTSSSGVYTYHSNITNAKLEVTIEYPNGKKSIKRYKIKM